ncbi:MAG TPA: protein-glutamate O-methyltransferase CheR [candidate division Zixibacteria bacterium]|nr:protein-glutamate O-methyltransferase CheR [candidate division Zixibacteria bacterium]
MITDPEGVEFLQWCLPRLGLRWPGFRKVRRQIYKRLNRRLEELRLPGLAPYRRYLEDHPGEWALLDGFCRIGISRFYRDRGVFELLEREIFPELGRLALERGDVALRCWSAGCAGGEEPYTVVIVWRHGVASRFPALALDVVATDVDPAAIRRAERACYRPSSVRELPADWRARAFTVVGDELCLKDEYRAAVTFRVEDVRDSAPGGPFHLILCRNLAFTYFDEPLQRKILGLLHDRLAAGGVLIIGKLERLPERPPGLQPWSPGSMGVYRKTPEDRNG